MSDPVRPPPKHGPQLALLAAFLGWMFDGFEMGLFPIVGRPALLAMLGPELGDAAVGKWMGYITAAFLLGAAAGGFFFGWLGDRIGRVRAMSLSILCYSLFTGLGYFATEPWHLGAFRFIAALGMGGEWSLGVALVMECWPERWRPLLAGVIGAAANVGFLLVGYVGKLMSVTTDNWRNMWLIGALPALLVFLIRLWVPESERWREAVRKEPGRPLRDIFAEGRWRNTVLAIGFASIALIGTWGSVQWIPVWVDQLTGGKVPSAKADVQMFSAFGAIVGSLLGPIIGGRLGRRPAFALLCAGSLLACGYLFRGGLAYGLAFQLNVLLVGAFTAAFYGWFPLYLPELFPTRMRATGQGVCFNAGRVIAAAGAIAGGQLVAAFGGDYARMGAVITLIYLLGLGLIWLAPETRGKPLPE